MFIHSQHQIAEFQKQYDLLRLTSGSLIKCHSRAVQDCTQDEETLGKYFPQCHDIQQLLILSPTPLQLVPRSLMAGIPT